MQFPVGAENDTQPSAWLFCFGSAPVRSASYLQWRVHLVRIQENDFTS